MQILFLVPFATTLQPPSGSWHGHTAKVRHWPSDWGKKGFSRLAFILKNALSLAREARRFDALVLCTTGIDGLLILRLAKILAPRTRIILFDFLIPRDSRLLSLLRPALKHAAAVACIRRGDLPYLQTHYHLSPSQIHFIPFPRDPSLAGYPTSDEGYIYSAGWAHRDWPTLLAALETLPHKAILSPGAPITIPEALKGRVQLLPMQPPAEGRRLMAAARLVVLPFHETHLPSGPLVLLDALSLGKPVVVTSVNGSRDYVTHNQNALVVPPANPTALAAAIDVAMADAPLRSRLAEAARTSATVALGEVLLPLIDPVTSPIPQPPQVGLAAP